MSCYKSTQGLQLKSRYWLSELSSAVSILLELVTYFCVAQEFIIEKEDFDK